VREVRAIRWLLLAGRIRLQKSSGGARQEASSGEEPGSSSSGLALPSESAERRKSVGSRRVAAKRRVRWRVPTQSVERELASGALIGGRRFGPWMSRALTSSWRKRSYRLGSHLLQVAGLGARRGASETNLQLDTRLKTPRSGGSANKRAPSSRVRGHVEVGDAPSSAPSLGAGPSRDSLAPYRAKRASVHSSGVVSAR
jgi:hypothetical protein